MHATQVLQILGEYRTSAGRLAHLEVEIKLLEGEIEHIKRTMLEDEALRGRDYELMDMPKSSGINNYVESMVLKYVSGFIPMDVLDLEREKRRLETELRATRIGVVFVDSWLSGVGERERWLLTGKYIDKKQWVVLVEEYNQLFNEQMSRWTLKKQLDRALAMVYDMAA